jgi:hypothetical protein
MVQEQSASGSIYVGLYIQVKKYGPVPAGKHWKSMEKIQKYSGWNTTSMFYHFPALSYRIQ